MREDVLALFPPGCMPHSAIFCEALQHWSTLVPAPHAERGQTLAREVVSWSQGGWGSSREACQLVALFFSDQLQMRLLIFQKLFVVEQQVPFTVQHVLDAGLGDDGVVTFEPLVFVLPDEAGVVTTLHGL